MLGFQALAALFALVMLARHLPRALAFVSAAAAKRRGPALPGEADAGRGPRAGSILDLFSVVLAVAILVVAVKALAAAVMS